MKQEYAFGLAQLCKKGPRPAKLLFEVFWPFLANFNHKTTYRRQTMNILLRHVGFIWLLVTCLKHTFFEKSKFRKIFLDFFCLFFYQKKNQKKIHKKIFCYFDPYELSICLFTFSEPFSDPKSVKIHPRKNRS